MRAVVRDSSKEVTENSGKERTSLSLVRQSSETLSSTLMLSGTAITCVWQDERGREREGEDARGRKEEAETEENRSRKRET